MQLEEVMLGSTPFPHLQLKCSFRLSMFNYALQIGLAQLTFLGIGFLGALTLGWVREGHDADVNDPDLLYPTKRKM
jgi:hypothetical protein